MRYFFRSLRPLYLILALILPFSMLSGCGEKLPAPVQSDAPSSPLLFQDYGDLRFFAENGEEIRLNEEAGTPLVLLYWASWCPHCQEALKTVDEWRKPLEQQGARVLLINKLDGQKETRESAREWLADHGIQTENRYDENTESYEALGLTKVPSLLIFDTESRLISISEGDLPSESRALSMLADAAQGKDTRLLRYITENLLGEDGGVRSGAEPTVLSESQGLLMRAALQNSDDALFQQLYGYSMAHRNAAGLFSWLDDSPVNALVDDFRIYRAMADFGAPESDLASLEESLFLHMVNGDRLVNDYNAETGEQAGRLTLCFADFAALEQLAKQNPRWQAVRENALSLVENGQISPAFPLYHNYYDYQENRYFTESLHMAEGLVTLLHLSEAGRLPAESIDWLEARMQEGYLYARYTADGRPARDGLFESTAIYALIAQIAVSENRPALAQKALTRMETLRVLDIQSPADGAFGHADGSGIYSFDQLMALLAYQQIGGV